MTHSGGQPHAIGDRGQRYEVRFKNSDGTELVMGWSSTVEGAEAMVGCVALHPSWHSAVVIDRKPDTLQ